MHVRIRKFIPFAKCDVCARLTELKNTARDDYEKRMYQTEKDSHIHLIMIMRARLAIRDELAMYFPDYFLSVMIDGMDSQKTNVPKTGGCRA